MVDKLFEKTSRNRSLKSFELNPRHICDILIDVDNEELKLNTKYEEAVRAMPSIHTDHINTLDTIRIRRVKDISELRRIEREMGCIK